MATMSKYMSAAMLDWIDNKPNVHLVAAQRPDVVNPEKRIVQERVVLQYIDHPIGLETHRGQNAERIPGYAYGVGPCKPRKELYGCYGYQGYYKRVIEPAPVQTVNGYAAVALGAAAVVAKNPVISRRWWKR